MPSTAAPPLREKVCRLPFSSIFLQLSGYIQIPNEYQITQESLHDSSRTVGAMSGK